MNQNNIQIQNKTIDPTSTNPPKKLHISSGSINSKQWTLPECTKISYISININKDITKDDSYKTTSHDRGTSTSNYNDDNKNMNSDSTCRRNSIDHDNLQHNPKSKYSYVCVSSIDCPSTV